MDQQNNNNNTGAPSTDTTSALFVSARKKQLEQQEAERQAKEREAERLAAEEEVRRLEQEVAERKRLAQEEAQRVEQEAARRREQARQEAQREAAMRAHTAEQPGAAYAQPKTATLKAGLPKNKLMLIVGAAAVLVVAVVLIVVLSSGGTGYDPKNLKGVITSADGLTLNYPEQWAADTLGYDKNGLILKADDAGTALAVMDVTIGLESAVSGGADAVTAAEGLMYDIAGVFANGSTVSDMEPQLTKSGSTVQGFADFRYQEGGSDMLGVARIESVAGARTILMAYAVPEGKSADKQQKTCEEILATLMIGDAGDGAGGEGAYWETDARFTFYSDGQTGIQAYVSTELEGTDNVMLGDEDVPFSGVSFGEKLMILDFTRLYRSMMEQGGSLADVVNIYLQFMEEANGEFLENVYIGEPVADATGTRIDFSFDMQGENVCALRLFEAADVCMIAVGHDLAAAAREYFDVTASSMDLVLG